MSDLTFLQIRKLIVHELPKQKGETGVLSDALSPLPAQVSDFFKLRLQTALSSSGVPIVFSDGHASPVRSAVETLLVKPDDAGFIASSQAIAQHMFDIMTKVHSPGLLCCLAGVIVKATFVAIVKLELQDGVRAHLKDLKGKKHFEIEVVDDLMLTKNTRVFKVALFRAGEDGTVEEILACDNQIPRGKMLAGYFLERFLGCQLEGKPDVMTKYFLERAAIYFNSEVRDPETRSRYYAGLLADLNTTKTTVQLKRFAEENLEPSDRAPFLQAMNEASVPRTFPKDITRVRTQLRRIRWEFDGDVTVTAPKEALDEEIVQIKSLDNGNTKLALEAPLKKVSHTGR